MPAMDLQEAVDTVVRGAVVADKEGDHKVTP
jgi:hypothetical protein